MEVLTALRRLGTNRLRAVLLVLLSAVGPLLWAGTTISKEYQVKALFLFNFAQFVQWPAGTFTGPDDTLNIGILGEDPFGGFLYNIVKGEKANGHPLAVQRFSRIEDVEDCQLLFVSASESKRLKNILAVMNGKSVLTVSDIEGFARSGGMIRLMMAGGKVHFRINLVSTKKARLRISSKLLRLAEIAGTERN
jgi:hypothetical protein